MVTLINSYENGKTEEFGRLVVTSISALPFTLSHPLEQLYATVDGGNYGKAKDYMLDFFELSAQYLSVVLLSVFRERLSQPDGLANEKELNRIAGVVQRIDSKRPLSFGDWCNDILPPLSSAVLALMPDSELSASLGRRTTAKNNLFVGGKNETSIVFLRNQYKGHGTVLSDEKYHELLQLVEPRLMQLLQALEPLCRCTTLMQGGHCWMEGDLGVAKVDLYPLVFSDENDYVYIFQSLNDEKACYVSANEQAVSLTTSDNNSAIDAFFQSFDPAFDIAKRRNWIQWRTLLNAESQRFLQGVYREKKYNRELFVERDGLTAQLKLFLESDATLQPLPGEAGQGKTNQLCYWTEQLLSDPKYLFEDSEGVPQTSVLILSGGELSGTNLETFLRRLFEVSPRKSLKKSLDEMHQAAEEAGSRLLIMVDALNECENYDMGLAEGSSEGDVDDRTRGSEQAAVLLFRDLLRLFVGQQYVRFKLLFTCRNYTWKQLLQPVLQASGNADSLTTVEQRTKGNNCQPSTVSGFTDTELERAYGIYGDVYSIHTPFHELRRDLAIRLKDPLVLKITCTNHLGHEMPDNRDDLTSLALWNGLYESIHNAYAGSKQTEIVEAVTDTILQGYLNGHAANSVSIPELEAAFKDDTHPLHRLSRLVFVPRHSSDSSSSTAISVAFAELINRPERPVLRYAENDRIQFVYERFLEYMLALALHRHFGSGLDAATVASFLQRVNPDEVMLGALRNLLIMHFRESRNDSSLIVELTANYSDDFLVMTLLTDLMNVLVRENYSELFLLENDLIRATGIKDFDRSVIDEFNKLSQVIDANKATGAVIARFNELHAELQPMLHLRTMAIQTLLGGIFLTDWFNERLYSDDPFQILWSLTDDPLVEVKDAVCLQSYYVSHQHFTLGGTPIKQNLSELIASRMYDWLDQHAVLSMLVNGRKRRRMITFLETATRLIVLLIIDVMLGGEETQQYRIKEMLDRLRTTVRHLTLNFTLVRLALPALNIVMRRQLTFQKDYVNNAIEYQRFWTAIPAADMAGRVSGDSSIPWNRSDLPDLMRFIYQYSRYYALGKGDEAPDFRQYSDRVMAAYQTGDSLSYFVVERLLVINGVCSWDSIEGLMRRFDDGSLKQTQWWDYTQMSIIYVLYQLGMKMPQMPEEVMEMLGRWCVDWTRRLRGWFVAPNSGIANPHQKYKRNVMTWYAMVYANRYGDERREAYQSVPLFYQLLDEAIDNCDGELVAHLVDNISELVADSGYVNTALDLLSHVMLRVDSEELLHRLGLQETLPSQIALLLSTSKSYAPAAVNAFLTNEILHFSFPGVENYREEILNYAPCGEKLSDVLTHRFGNFVIYALIHQQEVDDFCWQAAQRIDKTKDFTQWFAFVVRLLLRDLLKIKVRCD